MSAWIKKTLISLGKPVSNEPIDNTNNNSNINSNTTDEAKKLKMTQSAPATLASLPGPKISTIIDDEPSGRKKKKDKEKDKDKDKKNKLK